MILGCALAAFCLLAAPRARREGWDNVQPALPVFCCQLLADKKCRDRKASDDSRRLRAAPFVARTVLLRLLQ